jgi:hypothetical protein
LFGKILGLTSVWYCLTIRLQINTLGTGDAYLRHLRFCVINVKDG